MIGIQATSWSPSICKCVADVPAIRTLYARLLTMWRSRMKGQAKSKRSTTQSHSDGSQWLQICGWGSDSGTSYAPGTHTYTLYYKNREMGRGRFEVVKSPKQRGWIEPLALVLHFYNTDEEVQQWVTYDCALHIYEGNSLNRSLSKPIHTKGY